MIAKPTYQKFATPIAELTQQNEFSFQGNSSLNVDEKNDMDELRAMQTEKRL